MDSIQLSFNKIFKISQGQAVLCFSDKDGSSWNDWFLETNLIRALLDMRNAISFTAQQENICSFGLLGTHNVRTRRIHFDDKDIYLVCFSENFSKIEGEPKKSVMMRPDKFELFLDCLQRYVSGEKLPVDKQRDVDSDDLREIAKICMVQLFRRAINRHVRDKCYGCRNDRPSLKDHDFCTLTDDEKLDENEYKSILDGMDRYMLAIFCVLSFRVWLELNAGMLVPKQSSDLDSVKQIYQEAKYDHKQLLIMEENEIRGYDPSKIDAVRKLFAISDSI